MTKFHSVTKYAVDGATRLSMAHFDEGCGEKYAVALERKIGGKWQLDYATAVEIGGKFEDERGATYRALEVAGALVKSVIGALPERFFHQNNTVSA